MHAPLMQFTTNDYNHYDTSLLRFYSIKVSFGRSCRTAHVYCPDWVSTQVAERSSRDSHCGRAHR
jgi:hypothetical protein